MRSAASGPLASSRSTAAATTCGRTSATGSPACAGACATTRSGAACPRWATGSSSATPGDRFAIEALLPRRTKVSRKTPWLKAEEHILVANVDKVLLVAGLDGDFNPRRLERYLTAAWDSGADPVIVLTKLDVDDDGKLAEAEMVAVGVCPCGEQRDRRGIGASRRCWSPRRPSSSSARRGREIHARQPAGRPRGHGDGRASQGDGRGRHTTRHRQLLVMPDGAILIDTPATRAADLGGRHRQCVRRHRRAGRAVQVQRLRSLDGAGPCVVREAIESGELDEDRWRSYVKVAARAAGDRGPLEPPHPAGAEEPLAGACSRDATRPPLRRQAVARATCRPA